MRRALLVAVAILVAYHDALTARFVLDDYHYVIENAALGLRGIPGLFVHGYDSGGTTFYRPLSTATFVLDRALFGTWAAPFHAHNLVWHLVATLALLALLRRLFSPSAALAGALLFALHPVHVEAVTGVVGRMELMATAFALLGAVAWLDGRRGLALVFALLALWSKESGLLCAPLAVLLCGWRSGQWRRALRDGSWFVVPLAAYAALRTLALRGALLPPPDPLFQMVDAHRAFATVVGVLGRDLALLVWPHPLVADYGYAAIEPVASLLAPGPLLTMLAVSALVLASAVLRRARFVALGCAVVGIALLPVSNLVVHINVLMAERLLYAPSVGVAVLVAGLYALGETTFRPTRLVLGALCVVATVACLQRNLDWQTPLSLWTDTVEKQPNSALAHANLGLACETVGDRACALRELDVAIRIAPWRTAYTEARDQLERP